MDVTLLAYFYFARIYVMQESRPSFEDRDS